MTNRLPWKSATVGLILLAWPSPTLFVLSVVVATLVAATRVDQARWKLQILWLPVELGLGITLVARPGVSVGTTAVILGVLAMLDGLVEFLLACGWARVERARPVRSLAAVS